MLYNKIWMVQGNMHKVGEDAEEQRETKLPRFGNNILGGMRSKARTSLMERDIFKYKKAR